MTPTPTPIYNYTTIWTGEAEVNHRLKGETANDSITCPVALVSTKTGREKVMVFWRKKWINESSVEFSRDYCNKVNGVWVDPDYELCERIDAAINRGRINRK